MAWEEGGWWSYRNSETGDEDEGWKKYKGKSWKEMDIKIEERIKKNVYIEMGKKLWMK